MKRIPSLIALFLGSFLGSHAQESDFNDLPKEFFFRNISINDGLSHITVNSILRDSRGFIWIGTEDGLDRWDGSNFRVFRNNPRDSGSISHNLVYSVLEEKNTGNLWIGTVNGLCYYDRHREKITTIHSPNGPDRNAYIKMVFDEKRNRVWLACEEGGLRYLDVPTRQIVNFNHPAFRDESVLSLALAGDELYVGTSAHGLKILDLVNSSVETIDTQQSENKSLTNNTVKALLLTRDQLWIGTDGGLNLLARKGHTVTSLTREQHTLSGNRIRSLAEDKKGNVWVGTDGGGLSIVSSDRKTHFEYKHNEFDDRSVCDNTIRSIYIEPQGDAWLGTYGGGISYHSANSNDFYLFKKEFGAANSVSDNNINALATGLDGAVWIGTQNGLNYLKDGIIHHYPLDAYFHNDPQVITAVCEDRQGGLWIGTYQYGLLHRDKTGAVTHYMDTKGVRSINNNTVWSIEEDKGGQLWFSTESGVNIFNPSLKAFINSRNKPDGEFGNIFKGTQNQAILVARNGKVWIGTYGYLEMYDPTTGKAQMFNVISDSLRTIRNPPVAVLHETRAGDVLIGTFGNGLCIYRKATGMFSVLDETDGLPNNNVMSIEEDASGQWWLGTNAGIVRYDPVNRAFVTFDEGYGLQGQVFNPRASLQMSNGALFFGGVNGLNLFNPVEFLRDSSDLHVAFTDFQLYNKSIQPDGKILDKSISETDRVVLNYDNSRLIAFRFSCLNYFSRKIQYEYQLSGFDNSWHSLSGGAPLTFTNLDPDVYVLKIRAYINPKIKGTEKVLTITINPPWYRTWIARISAALGVLGIFLLSMWLRMRRLNERKLELERQVAGQSREILVQNDKLKVQNETLLGKNEEILAQAEELTHANKVLTELHREVSEQKEEIQTQSEELTESYVAISQLNQTLEEKIEDRTSELRKAFRELDTFFYRSSHDFRRPITTFMGLAQVARFSVKDPAAIELFEKVDQTARHLDRMVKKLQAVSDVGSQEIPVGEISIQDIVNQTLMSVRSDIVRNHIDVRTKIEVMTALTTYPLLVKIVVENLIENAAHFHGPVSPYIQITATRSEGGILFEVNDNGRGIDEQYHSRIFEMYFRASEVSKGNGLGLFIVRKAVERLGGTITFVSEKNLGSRFSFWFKGD